MRISDYSALYSVLDRKYSQVMSGPYHDLSDKGEGEIVAGLKDGIVTGFWRPMVAVGTRKWLRNKIESIWKLSHDIVYMDFLIDNQITYVTRFLLDNGYEAVPVFTQVIDLSKSEKNLYRDLRKSYKQLIKSGLASVLSFPEAVDVVKGFRPVRERAEETWEIQKEMVISSEAFVVKSDRAACLVYHNTNWAYYASGASNGNSHSVLWKAITHAKSLGIRWFETGEQVFEPGKLKDISNFKKGFGGNTVTRLLVKKGKQ